MTTKISTKSKVPFGVKSTVPDTNSESLVKKWNHGINQQKEIYSESLNVQMIPLSQVKLDPNNSRTISITLHEIENGPKVLPTTFSDDDSEATFRSDVECFFNNDENKETKIADYLSLAIFAASIGDHHKLINPITVYLDGMDFHLVAGHRRTLAHSMMNSKFIAAKILPSQPNDFEHGLLQWKENKDREDLTLIDEIDNIDKIIRAWELDNNASISVRKLMSVLNLRKTKAACYLAVTKSIRVDPLFHQAIRSEAITSLEVSYNIAVMENVKERTALLKELLAGKKFSYKQIMARIKSPEISVRTPDTSLINAHKGLVVNRNTNIDVLSKIIRLIIKSPEFKGYQTEFEKINTTSKPGILAAWEKIHDLLHE